MLDGVLSASEMARVTGLTKETAARWIAEVEANWYAGVSDPTQLAATTRKYAPTCHGCATEGRARKAKAPDFSGAFGGAGHGIRTRDFQLGKLTLYQLS